MSKEQSVARDESSLDLKEKASKVKELLEMHKKERHVLVVHDYPDPDAISCAYAHKIICEAYAIETDIVYQGKISHEQNLALVKLLKIDIQSFHGSLEKGKYEAAVFVDNQGSTCKGIVEELQKAQVPTLMVVDHHEPQELLQPEFSDVRDIGATAVIYAQYLQNGLLDMDASNENHVKMATALMHGLITDTHNFLQAGPDEFKAAAYLSHFHDMELLSQIMNQSRSKKTMEIIKKALENRVVADSFSLAGVGYLREEDRDVIPLVADFLVTEENVHTAFVYGIVGGEDEEALVGSMRTTRITMDTDEFLKDVFGKDASGNYFGGGKNAAGGVKVPIGFLAGEVDEEYKKVKWQTFDYQIKQRIFKRIGYEEEDQD